MYVISKAARDNRITALDNEFCDEELSEAKELLWKVSRDGILGQFFKGTDRTKRHAKSTYIVDGLKKLDQESIVKSTSVKVTTKTVINENTSRDEENIRDTNSGAATSIDEDKSNTSSNDLKSGFQPPVWEKKR